MPRCAPVVEARHYTSFLLASDRLQIGVAKRKILQKGVHKTIVNTFCTPLAQLITIITPGTFLYK